jgi:hypothetical protein
MVVLYHAMQKLMGRLIVNLQQQFLSIVLKQKAVDSAWMAEGLGVTMSLLKEYGGQ